MPPSTPADPSSAGGGRPRAIPVAPPRPAARGTAAAGHAQRFGRQLVIFVVLVAALLVTVAAISGERGYLDVRRQKAQLSRLRAEVAALRDENASFLAEVRGLRSDPFLLEVIAREKLGYARPGEIVFMFQPGDPPVKESPRPRAPAP